MEISESHDKKGGGQVDIFIIMDIGHLVLALVSWRWASLTLWTTSVIEKFVFSNPHLFALFPHLPERFCFQAGFCLANNPWLLHPTLT